LARDPFDDFDNQRFWAGANLVRTYEEAPTLDVFQKLGRIDGRVAGLIRDRVLNLPVKRIFSPQRHLVQRRDGRWQRGGAERFPTSEKQELGHALSQLGYPPEVAAGTGARAWRRAPLGNRIEHGQFMNVAHDGVPVAAQRP
jgi:hypothetical protein